MPSFKSGIRSAFLEFKINKIPHFLGNSLRFLGQVSTADRTIHSAGCYRPSFIFLFSEASILKLKAEKYLFIRCCYGIKQEGYRKKEIEPQDKA